MLRRLVIRFYYCAYYVPPGRRRSISAGGQFDFC
jgi:hypothetical protein